MSFKHQAIKKAMLQRLSAGDRNIPKYVQDKAEFFEKEKGYDPAYAFSTAWSIYCKYKNPGDTVHCKKDPSEYFTGKTAGFKYAGAVKEMLMDIIFECVEYLQKTSHVDDDDGYIFEATQEFVMADYNHFAEESLEDLLNTKGVSPSITNKYLNMVKNKTKHL